MCDLFLTNWKMVNEIECAFECNIILIFFKIRVVSLFVPFKAVYRHFRRSNTLLKPTIWQRTLVDSFSKHGVSLSVSATRALSRNNNAIRCFLQTNTQLLSTNNQLAVTLWLRVSFPAEILCCSMSRQALGWSRFRVTGASILSQTSCSVDGI